MTDQPNRVSNKNLADVLATAISLEKERIVELDADTASQVSGGLSNPIIIGPVGFFPVDPY